MKTLLIAFFFTFFLVSCSTPINNSSSFTSNQSTESQIFNLDAQIAHIDSMINSARARKNMNLTSGSALDNSMIDNEIMMYETQKTNILSQKHNLLLQLGH